MATQDLTLGELQLSGTACVTSGAGSQSLEIVDDKLEIPISLMAKKANGSGILRGTCAFSLPLQMAPGRRLVVSETSIPGLLNLAKGSSSRVSAEIFKVGDHGQVLTDMSSATAKKIKKSIELTQAGQVLLVDCGESTILRGNLSALIQGTGRATVSLGALELGAKVEVCAE